MPTGTPGRTHGLVSTYVWGCRCDACVDARRRYYGHRPREVYLAAIEARHGTESRYTSQSCRCGPCVHAANEARAERRRINGPGPMALHGKHSTYSNGCRCDACREANTDYSRERDRKRREAATA